MKEMDLISYKKELEKKKDEKEEHKAEIIFLADEFKEE